ncbi:unnamed protein product, partial [Adineta steineri]
MDKKSFYSCRIIKEKSKYQLYQYFLSQNNKIYIFKINVTLNGDQFSDPNIIADDLPFKSTLIYVNSEGVSVDLFQLYGAQTHMGRYGALVMDKLFTLEEITTITKDEL